MSSDQHSAAALCRSHHGEHVLGLQGMIPTRKNKGSKGIGGSWYHDAGEMPMPLTGGKARKHCEGGFKVKQAPGGKSSVNKDPGGRDHKVVILQPGQQIRDTLGWGKTQWQKFRKGKKQAPGGKSSVNEDPGGGDHKVVILQPGQQIREALGWGKTQWQKIREGTNPPGEKSEGEKSAITAAGAADTWYLPERKDKGSKGLSVPYAQGQTRVSQSSAKMAITRSKRKRIGWDYCSFRKFVYDSVPDDSYTQDKKNAHRRLQDCKRQRSERSPGRDTPAGAADT
jgi:hypothetical protein